MDSLIGILILIGIFSSFSKKKKQKAQKQTAQTQSPVPQPAPKPEKLSGQTKIPFTKEEWDAFLEDVEQQEKTPAPQPAKSVKAVKPAKAVKAAKAAKDWATSDRIRDDLKAPGHQGTVLRSDVGSAGNMGLRDHQNVGGCLGGNILKGQNLVIFINLLGGDVTRNDLTKQAVCHNQYPPLFLFRRLGRPVIGHVHSITQNGLFFNLKRV